MSHFDDHGIGLGKDLVAFFLRISRIGIRFGRWRQNRPDLSVVVEDSQPGSHAIGNRTHIFGIYLVILKLADDVAAEGQSRPRYLKGGAKLDIGDILHHIPAHAAVNVFNLSAFRPVGR